MNGEKWNSSLSGQVPYKLYMGPDKELFLDVALKYKATSRHEVIKVSRQVQYLMQNVTTVIESISSTVSEPTARNRLLNTSFPFIDPLRYKKTCSIGI